MRLPRTAVTAAATALLLIAAAPAHAISGAPGGAAAPGGSPPAPAASGGSGASATTGTHAAGHSSGSAASAPAVWPAVRSLSVPARAPAGPPPRVTLRVGEQGAATLYVAVALLDSSRHTVLRVAMGWVRTERTLTVHWPAAAALTAGTYLVHVGVRDHHGATLPHSARTSNTATLRITAPPAPAPTSAPAASPPPVVAGAASPAQTVAAGAVFPVHGEHSFGGPENRFGAAREGHVHEGQDVLTAEGTPILAPLAGTITSTSYQASGAGYYAVEHTPLGLDLMFAHCQAGSLAVSEGASVSAGTRLCLAGQTGDATAPHLHLEIWVGGWWAPGAYPIDPLPYLEAWEHGSL